MRNPMVRARLLAMIGIGFVALVGGGCEWSGDAEPDPSLMFERTIEFYGSSRAYGEHAQSIMVKKPKSAAESWGRSRRFAQFITDGEWSTAEQAEFQRELKSLLFTWSSANHRALEAAHAGDFSRLETELKQADEQEAQIDELISTSDIERITDGEYSAADFTREWRRGAARIVKDEGT